ncbi:MAG: galactose-1-phosphate uridylyltransferase [Pseudomonadota bacterium]
MTIDIEEISEGVFKRRHVKDDGRDVFLYGHRPPDEPALKKGLSLDGASSELRWHPLRAEWSIYAAGRQGRTYKPSAAEDPLLPSRLEGPPTEVPFSTFEICVFENRFPSLAQTAHADWSAAIPGVRHGVSKGRCEVVVYTPEQSGSLATLTQARRILLVHAWIDRYKALFDMGCEFVLPFENRGDEVGVTLHHPHGQIYGFPFVPGVHQSACRAFREGFDLEQCIEDWTPIFGIVAREEMAAFAPPFARFPFEVWVAPKKKSPGPWTFSTAEIDSFAFLLGDIVRRYDAYFGRPCPYMLTLHASPKSDTEDFHFTAQFYPLLRSPTKVKYLASVEQATNVFTVDILPEQTASELRPL